MRRDYVAKKGKKSKIYASCGNKGDNDTKLQRSLKIGQNQGSIQ